MLNPLETENIIFFDTEFTSLDPYSGEILSVGIIKLSGEELYLELECDATPSLWVKKHVIPTLQQQKVSRTRVVELINEFLDNANPFAVAFVDNYDTIYMTKLFGEGNLPFRWMTVDMSSILFAIGVNPVKFMPGETGATRFYKKLGIDLKKYKKHYALDDAKLLRDVWLKMVEAVPVAKSDKSR